IDVRNGNQLWAQGYRRTLKNIFEVEAEVAEKVAEALKVKLVRAEAQRLATPATTNPRAHDLYLRAHALGTHSDEQSLEQTITLLRQALIEDPHFALAWGDLAWAYLSIVDAYRAPLEILTPAEYAALMAVANDEHAGAGHTYFGAIALILTAIFRWRNASWNVVSPSILFRPMLTAGMPGISRAWKEISLPRAPNWNGPKRSTRSTLGQPGPHRLSPLLRAITKRPCSSRNASSRSIRISYTTRIRFAHVYVAKGRWQDGVKRYESLSASALGGPNFELAVCYAHTGETAQAKQILKELEARAQHRYVDRTHIAAIHAALGDNDKAFAELDQARQDRSARISAPRFYPWLAPLFDDSRFADLLHRIGLDSQNKK